MVLPSPLRMADTRSRRSRAAKTLRLRASALPGGELAGRIHAAAAASGRVSVVPPGGSPTYPSSLPSADSETLPGDVSGGSVHCLSAPSAMTPMVAEARTAVHGTDP